LGLKQGGEYKWKNKIFCNRRIRWEVGKTYFNKITFKKKGGYTGGLKTPPQKYTPTL